MAYDHIILVSVDTLRADALAATPTSILRTKYGLRVLPETPALNQIAENGAYFSRTLSAAPYTSAAHASYFTGLWPLHHGLYEFYNGSLEEESIFTAARAAGYATLFKTDFPVILGGYLGFKRDIDRYIVEDDDAFLDALSRQTRSVSFVHFGGVHLPYGFHNLKYGGTAYKDKVAQLMRETGIRDVQPVDQLVETYCSEEDLHYLLAYKTATEFFYGRSDYQRLMELYVEGVNFFMRHRFDPFLKRLLAIAEKSNSLIVVFSDHGEEYDAGSRGHYDSVNEGVLRTPMIFFGPGIKSLQVDHMVRSVDLVPTIYELQGWSGSVALDGSSLAATLHSDSFQGMEHGRVAFAQTYVSDTEEFLKVQKKTIAMENVTVHLKHVLYKERAWCDERRVTRQLHGYEDRISFKNLGPIDIVQQSDVRRVDGQYHAIRGENTDLLAALMQYNRSRRREAVPRSTTTDLLQHLKAMGYKL